MPGKQENIPHYAVCIMRIHATLVIVGCSITSDYEEHVDKASEEIKNYLKVKSLDKSTISGMVA